VKTLDLTEPFGLGSGIALFSMLAMLAVGGERAPARGSADGGVLAFDATLSQAKLQRESDGGVLLHVRLNGAAAVGRLPIDVALALDLSSSAVSKVQLMAQACEQIARQLGPEDRIAVVTFTSEARSVLRPDGGSLEGLVSGQGCNVSAGLEVAAQELRRFARPGSARRIVLMTGARPDRGLTRREDLQAQAARLASEGISISALGLGLGYDAALLKAVSDAGGGNYHHLEDASRLGALCGAEFRALRALVARNVRLKLVPAPGVEVERVTEWTTLGDRDRTDVLVGDFEGGRSSKVVVRLRVPVGRSGKDVVKVGLEGEDVRTGGVISSEVGLGVGFTDSESEALASAATDIERDLADAQVAMDLRRAQECAQRRDAAGARAALARVGRIRPMLEYRGADGTVVRKSVDSLESEMLWFASRGDEPGMLSKLVDSAKSAFISTRQHGNEAAAIGALKTLATSQSIYREGDKDQNGNLDYGTLEELARTGLVDSVLGAGTKQGYQFEVHKSTKNPEYLWFAVARPTTPGSTGDRFFYTNQAGVIFYSTTPFDVDPETCQVNPKRYDAMAEKFVESVVVPTGK
jgi:Ca-activated chloride channel family protein